MKKKYIIGLIVIIICSVILLYINSSYHRLKALYRNPLSINEKYKDYSYDEYNNHVTIRTYNGRKKNVKIPEYINDKLVYAIDDSAFYGNTRLEKVEMPKYVMRIGHQSFIGNANLKEVILPDKIIEIGDWAFKGCPKLEKIYVKKGSKTDKTLQNTSFKKYIVYKK